MLQDLPRCRTRARRQYRWPQTVEKNKIRISTSSRAPPGSSVTGTSYGITEAPMQTRSRRRLGRPPSRHLIAGPGGLSGANLSSARGPHVHGPPVEPRGRGGRQEKEAGPRGTGDRDWRRPAGSERSPPAPATDPVGGSRPATRSRPARSRCTASVRTITTPPVACPRGAPLDGSDPPLPTPPPPLDRASPRCTTASRRRPIARAARSCPGCRPRARNGGDPPPSRPRERRWAVPTSPTRPRGRLLVCPDSLTCPDG